MPRFRKHVAQHAIDAAMIKYPNLSELIHRKRRYKTVAEIFWSKVVKKNGCWSWNGPKSLVNRSMIYAQDGGKKSVYTAARVSWVVHNGEIPSGLWVLHKCDNPECTNPEHLFLGTRKDNVNDCVSKGRNYKPKKGQMKSHCDHGHALTESNTANKKHGRQCRMCHILYMRKRRKDDRDLRNISSRGRPLPNSVP